MHKNAMNAAIDTVMQGLSSHSATKGDNIEESLPAIFVTANIPAFNSGGKY